MNKPSQQKNVRIAAALLAAALLTACGSNPRRGNDASDTFVQSPDVYYTVERGDQLSKIAAEVTGDAANWTQIAEINGIDDPRKIQVGQQIVVPGNLLPLEIAESVTTSVPTAVAIKSAERAPVQSTVWVDPEANAVTEDVVITKADPNKRFVLKPFGEDGETAAVDLSDNSYVKVIGSYFPKVVYQAPQLNAKLLMRVAPGTTFPLEKLDNGWYRVSTDQGSGFLRIEDGEPVSAEG